MVGHLWKSCGAKCDELILCRERVPISRKGFIIIYNICIYARRGGRGTQYGDAFIL